MKASSSSDNKTRRWASGQRWISTAEPELGLGTVLSAANRRIELFFDTHATSRTFATDSAPLQRIIFNPGTTIEDTSGNRYTVTSVIDDPATGLVTYECNGSHLSEDELSDTLSFSTPDQRLMAGIADDIASFTLRSSMLEHRAKITGSPIRGFAGGRIDQLPHQLSIAHQATAHNTVRVLLADETGLGKTIEASLILHRMLITGQVRRALILVPDALVHQWFVELLRRFNLLCRLFSDESIDDNAEGELFARDPLWICSIAKIRQQETFAQQLVATQWDLVIIDEAHHITTKDPFFNHLTTLAETAPSMILLSATPEQFGRAGHLARLRLLDPHRYGTPEDSDEEARRLQLIAACITSHSSSTTTPLTPQTVIPLSKELHKLLCTRQKKYGTPNCAPIPRELSIERMVDLFGAGRAYFRNTRRTISGFPRRIAKITRLSAPAKTSSTVQAAWITDFLKTHRERKVLVITSTIESVLALRENIQQTVSIDIAVFHESMTLLQRDRQAAWFAEEYGARMLICSESGSEGRNFQFCNDLILLEVPWNPELLEQRIGRLDRIGQKNTIQLHIPVLQGSSQDILCTWYHEAVNVFEKNVPAAAVVFKKAQEELTTIAALVPTSPDKAAKQLSHCIHTSKERVNALSNDLYNHRDYLLEFASNNRQHAEELITTLAAESADSRAERIIMPLFRHYGIKLEEAGSNRSALITEFCTDHTFPLPRAERPVITFNLPTACTYDTTEFLTIDHPMVTGALELYLSSADGSSSFALWNDLTASELLLESLHIVECIAPAAMRVFRFFTPTPLRSVVNHHHHLVTDHYPETLLNGHCKNGPINKLIAQKKLISDTFPQLVHSSDSFVKELAIPAITTAQTRMHKAYQSERSRLLQLQAYGAPIGNDEVATLEKEEEELHTLIGASRIRRDSLRFIWRGPVKGN